MGYEGKRRKSGEFYWYQEARRPVGKFWAWDGVVVITALGIIIFFWGILLARFTTFSSQEQEEKQMREEDVSPFIPPLLDRKPERPLLPWQKKRGMIPIHRSGGGHHGGHHGYRGHHDDGHHYYSPYYHPYYYRQPPIIVDPWYGG